MSAPGIDIVIVSFRCRELLRTCLESVERYSPQRPVDVYVVDNGSLDGTVEMVRTTAPGVRVQDTGRNLGFAAANNIAIGMGRREFVLALNPDTRLTEGCLDQLLAVMDARPEIGIVGCRLEREDGTLDHAAKRSFPTPLSALGHFTGVGRMSWAPRALAAYRAPEVTAGPVEAVNGAFMLIRRAALDEVGTFDEGYWMYMEDLDLCYRFAQAGWLTWYEPNVSATHVKGGSSGKRRSFRLNRAFHYGMYRFYRRHYAGGRAPAVNGTVYAGIATKFVVSAARAIVAGTVAGVRRAQ